MRALVSFLILLSSLSHASSVEISRPNKNKESAVQAPIVAAAPKRLKLITAEIIKSETPKEEPALEAKCETQAVISVQENKLALSDLWFWLGQAQHGQITWNTFLSKLKPFSKKIPGRETPVLSIGHVDQMTDVLYSIAGALSYTLSADEIKAVFEIIDLLSTQKIHYEIEYKREAYSFLLRELYYDRSGHSVEACQSQLFKYAVKALQDLWHNPQARASKALTVSSYIQYAGVVSESTYADFHSKIINAIFEIHGLPGLYELVRTDALQWPGVQDAVRLKALEVVFEFSSRSLEAKYFLRRILSEKTWPPVPLWGNPPEPKYAAIVKKIAAHYYSRTSFDFTIRKRAAAYELQQKRLRVVEYLKNLPQLKRRGGAVQVQKVQQQLAVELQDIQAALETQTEKIKLAIVDVGGGVLVIKNPSL